MRPPSSSPQPLSGDDGSDLRDAFLDVAVDDHVIIFRPVAHLLGRLGHPRGDHGRAVLGALLQAPPNVQNWHGPYIKGGALPKDPWGNVYIYRYPGAQNQNQYDLYSFGPDQREGNDDITNWSH